MFSQNRLKEFSLRAAQTALVSAFGLCLVAALHPDARSNVRASLVEDYRKVLSSAEADLNGDGGTYMVAKIETRTGVLIEVYKKSEDGTFRLTERIALADAKDGYFSFSGHARNLVIEDIDGDNKPEILAPTFDRDLVGRLNIFRLSQTGSSLDRVIR